MLVRQQRVMAQFRAAWLVALLGSLTTGGFAHVLGHEGIAPKLPPDIPGLDRPFPKSADKFTFAVVGDKTGGGLENWPIFDRAMDEISRLRPDFAIMVGDLIQGYVTDPTVMDEQWKEFTEHASRIRVPFFFLPGNHDISNKTMHDYWSKNVGKTFYSFDYNGCHFILLNTEEGWRTDEVQFGAAQMEWLRQDIEANRNAKHLFFFMHRPVWYHSGDALAEWEQVETWVQGLPYTVFAGHFHNLTHEVRKERPYYVLAATGGGLEPKDVLELGAFHHYTNVIVDGDDVHIAVIQPGHVHPHDIAMREFKDRANQALTWGGSWSSFAQPPWSDYGVNVSNTLDEPMTVSVRFAAPDGSGWRSNPLERSLTILPGEQASLGFSLRYDFDTVFPLPSFTYEATYGGKPMWTGKREIAAPDTLIIKQWMVSGPFPLGVEHAPSNGSGLETAPAAFNDPLPPENKADFTHVTALGDGKYAFGEDKLEWRDVWVEDGGWVNLNSIYGGDYRIGYGLCHIESPDDRTVYATLRGDDLAKVFVNDVPVHAVGGSAAQGTFKLPLKKGWNPILVKTADYEKDWGFSLQIVNISANGLKFAHLLPPSEE